jgi:hypothetical protein
VLAGTTFAYYFLSLRLPPADPRRTKMGRGFQAAAIAVAAIAVVWGATIVGSPASERARKYDDRRIEDLRAISDQIREMVLSNQWASRDELKMTRELPKTLAEVSAAQTYRKLDVNDPETSEPYRYEVTGKSTFRLCAKFSEKRDRRYDIFWNHPEGEHCFKFDVLDWHGK